MQLCVCVCTVYNTPAIADMRVHVHMSPLSVQVMAQVRLQWGKTSSQNRIFLNALPPFPTVPPAPVELVSSDTLMTVDSRSSSQCMSVRLSRGNISHISSGESLSM